ncbi:hypothetical protein AB0F42_21645 [Streptomyces buecherae]|uniref:hypothetical protein n=1 Tax=Streptomyces buecherae TaxID=2763006 RepID=UPI0033FFE0A8
MTGAKRVLQCTAVGDFDGALWLCELGERHDGEHADPLVDVDPWGAVWLRWSATTARLVPLP